MKAARMAAQAACWTLLHLYLLAILQVEASGVFELHLQSFRNDKELNADGNCCNGYRSDGRCTASCRTFFRVCLTHYIAAIASEPNPSCTFGEYTSPVVAGNSANVSVSTDLSAVDSPIRFPITEFSWPGDFSLIIEAWHDTTLSEPSPGSPRELISRLAVQRSAAAGLDWYNSRQTTRYTELLYSYRFVCDDTYYGAACEVLCRHRDDHFGHYYCSQNGTKVCLDGWKGEYCDDAICLSGCHPDHGYCDTPYECSCRRGWEGRHCNVCTPHPECQHGTCDVKPYECNCQEGWGGLLCNQDLNFCTHHSPCQNGGTCTNTGLGSYTCNCRSGFSGRDCEITVDHCLDQPCLHGATCQSTETGYTCTCPTGYFGTECEQEANFCRPETCYNGGTCVDHDGSYQCLCAQGYAGFHCEKDTGGCKQDTCKNGGHCVSGQCICPADFFGPTCEDDGHDYCALKPCKNGGTCMDLTNDFECRCVAGFVGPTCDVNVDDCEMRPCANGGHCTDLVNDFQCRCSPGWVGKDCSINENNCLSQPCKNGGVCVDRIDDYECRCQEGFWSKDCHLYHGMSTSSLSPTTHTLNATTATPPTTEDPLHQSGNTSGQGGGRSQEDQVIKMELLLGVCLGVGLPILIVIICAAVVLCRKARRRSRDNMDKERQDNYLNNISVINTTRKASDRAAKRLDDPGEGTLSARATARKADSKLEGDGGGGGPSSPIFTTSGLHPAAVMMPPAPPPPTAAAAVAKVSNEEQQDINRLTSHQASRGKAATKNFIRDKLGVHEPAHPSPLPTLPSHRDSRVYDFEKPIRRLEVDPLSGDTQVDISTYRRHSGDITIVGKSNLAPLPERDTVRRSVYLEPAHPRRSRYTESDYLATEV